MVPGMTRHDDEWDVPDRCPRCGSYDPCGCKPYRPADFTDYRDRLEDRIEEG